MRCVNDRDTELLRSELFSIEQLKRHAVTLAGQHRIDPRPGPDRLLPRLADNARVLLAAYDVVTAAATSGQRIAPAEAWLLDNYYLIEQQIALARRHLPRGYSRQLPRLADGQSAGFPRIYELALELISHMDGRVDSDNATQFVAAYQTVEPLKLGELWAFPIMLQLALLENLRRVGVAYRPSARGARRGHHLGGPHARDGRTGTETAYPVAGRVCQCRCAADRAVCGGVLRRLQAQGPAMAFVQTWVEHKLLEQGVTATQLSAAAGTHGRGQPDLHRQQYRQPAFHRRNGLAEITSSRSVSSNRPCVKTRRRCTPARISPPATATGMPSKTWRGVVRSARAVSRRWHAQPLRSRRRAAERLGTSDRSAHVGYYLIDHGRSLLERAVGCRLPWRRRVSRASRHFRLFLYLGPILLLTLAFDSGRAVAVRRVRAG